MLNEDEKKLLLKTYHYAKLSHLYLLSVFVFAGAFLFLTMIDGAFLNATDVYMVAVVLFIVGLIVFMFLWGRSYLSQVNRKHNEAWHELCQKAQVYIEENYEEGMRTGRGLYYGGRMLDGTSSSNIGTAFQIVGGILMIGNITFQSMKTAQQCEFIADVYGIALPNMKKKQWAIFLVPVLIMTICYIPRYIDTVQTNNEKTAALDAVMDDVMAVFEAEFVDSYASDTASGRTYYYIRGSLDDDTYVSIDLWSDASVDEITYYFPIDTSLDAQTNIANAQEALTTMNAIIAKTCIQDSDPDLVAVDTIPEGIVDVMETNGMDAYAYYNEETGIYEVTVCYLGDEDEPYLFMNVEYD